MGNVIIPQLMQLEITYSCNQTCGFCYNPRRDDCFDKEKIDKMVEIVAYYGIPIIYLIGGEPSVLGVDVLNNYIDVLSKKSNVVIVTNGLKRLENISTKLAMLGIPIHGTTPEEHDGVTGVRGSFKKVTDNIKYYKGLGIDIRIVLVLTKKNYNRIYDFIKVAASLSPSSIYIDRYEEGGVYGGKSGIDEYMPSLAEFRESVTQILDAKATLSFSGEIAFGTAVPVCSDERLLQNKLFSNCGAGSKFVAINTDGMIRACNQSEIYLGNIFEDDFLTLWNDSEKMSCVRDRPWLSDVCKDCAALESCGSGCIVDTSCSPDFCSDYFARNCDKVLLENKGKLMENVVEPLISLEESNQYSEELIISASYKFNRFIKVNKYYIKGIQIFLLVGQYYEMELGRVEYNLISFLLKKKNFNIEDVLDYIGDGEGVKEAVLSFMRRLLSQGFIEQLPFYKTVEEFQIAINKNFTNLEYVCKTCTKPECKGMVLIYPHEIEKFLHQGIELVQFNNEVCVLHPFTVSEDMSISLSSQRGDKTCVFLEKGEEGRLCTIHSHKPLTCSMYPIVPVKAQNGMLTFGFHADCDYFQQAILSPNYDRVITDFCEIIDRTEPSILKMMYETFQAHQKYTRFPNGYNQYMVIFSKYIHLDDNDKFK